MVRRTRPGISRFRVLVFDEPRNDRGQRRGWLGRCLRQQPQPQILRDVGVLIFVDQDVFEAVLVLPQDVRVFAEDAEEARALARAMRGRS